MRSVLHYLEKWGTPKPQELSVEAATTLANRLLMTAAEFDTATGGVMPERRLFATIKLLTTGGIKTVLPEEHEQYWGTNK